jgi:Centromere DNA-binding protein complex CBF3 subunit, domain 2
MMYDAAIHQPWPYCEERYTTSRESTNKTYKSKYKLFIEWFAEHNVAHSLTTTEGEFGTIFVTPHNVDQYYKYYVVNTKGKADTVKKHFNSLDWYLKHVENPGTNGLDMTPVIRNAIRQQQINHKAQSTVDNQGVDPHKGIKDLLSEEDNEKILNYIYKHRLDDSLDILFDYTWGRNAGVRGQSSRSFVLNDLNLSTGFGPETAAPRNRTLLLILRKGNIHKDRFTVDRQVGVYRHVDYRQCAVFATGLLLIRRLRYLNNTISFTKPRKNRPALWWGKSLTRFDDYDAAAHAMTEVLKGTKVELNKVTHHRTQAVLLGGARGLNDEQISRFTKHKTDKLHTSYSAEVEEEALNVMAGFRKAEPRFVKEEHILFPHDNFVKDAMLVLLPRYQQYLTQRASKGGDKGRACRTLLTKVIPYLVEVVLQDGIYFIMDFPDHQMSNLLRVSQSITVLVYVLYSYCTRIVLVLYYYCAVTVLYYSTVLLVVLYSYCTVLYCTSTVMY